MIRYNGIEQWITDSDEEEDPRSRRRSTKYDDLESDQFYKKKSRVRFGGKLNDETDSDYARRYRHGKKKNRYDSDSDSDDKRRRRRGRQDSSSEDSDSDTDESISNVRTYTQWKKDRVPYCDEFEFICQKWLATDEGDKKIARDFKPESIVTYYRVPKPDKRKGKHRK